MRARTVLALIAMLASTAAVAHPAVGSAAGTSPYGDQPIDWQTVLVAGDDSVVAFDNGITALHQSLAARGVDDVVELRASHGLASAGSVGQAIEGIQARPGEGCLVYMTSHGSESGLFLANDGFYSDEDLLSPDELTGMLDRGCGRAPTVLIVSACHSGTFLTEAMKRPNRVVIAAARTDRTSFGCSDEYQFTFFDECVLGALPAAVDWGTLYNDVTGCVNAKEGQLGATPSLPQFFEGDAVSQIGLPAPVAVG
jgi:hypothetical protein